MSSKITRNNSEELDNLIGKTLPVLDKGFVRVIDYMGTDNSIVQAARVSYGDGTKSISEDSSLIRYLMKNKHTSPFEMCEIKLHVKLPIFVARQWIRHRTANVNEYSARYSVMNNEFYIPEGNVLCKQSTSNKQGSGEHIGDYLANKIKIGIYESSDYASEIYNMFLDNGLSRELSRIVLPLNIYTEWYWKIDVNNLLHFLHLRLDKHSQYEIRCYAEVILDIVKKWLPLTYDAFNDCTLNGISLTGKGKDVIKRLLLGEKVTFENSNLSKREWDELKDTFNIRE